MKIKYPISLKQILLFSFLIILGLGVSTALVSTLIRTDDRIKAEENNLALNGRTAQTVQASFDNIQSNSYVLFEAFSAAANLKISFSPSKIPIFFFLTVKIPAFF